MKHSEILKAAIKHLHPGFTAKGESLPYESEYVSPYICDAIDHVYYPADYCYKAYDIKQLIRERIQRQFGIDCWLVNFKGVNRSELHHPELLNSFDQHGTEKPALQAYRKAWMLELIREYEAKGD